MSLITDDQPPALAYDTPRVEPETGRPSTALLDYETLANAWFARTVVQMDKRLTQVKSQADANTAAITIEATTRADADDAFAELMTTVQAEFDDFMASVTQQFLALANEDEALAQSITTVQANLNDVSASVVQESTARVTGDSALASSIETVSTSLAGNTAAVETLSESIDGISARHGVKLVLNQAWGGYEIVGAQRQDGTGATFDLTFTANSFKVTDPSYNGGSPGNVVYYSGGYWRFGVPVVIDTGEIANGAVSTTHYASSGGASCSITLYVRGGARLLVIANFQGAPDVALGSTTNVGAVRIIRDGNEVRTQTCNFSVLNSGGSKAILQTSVFLADDPSQGFHTYDMDVTNNAGVGGVQLIVQELAR